MKFPFQEGAFENAVCKMTIILFDLSVCEQVNICDDPPRMRSTHSDTG